MSAHAFILASADIFEMDCKVSVDHEFGEEG
jgi:hypothetical protein